MRIVLCGPYPLDSQERASGDGLMQAVVTLAQALVNERQAEVHVLSRSTRIGGELSRVVGEVRVTWVPDPHPQVDYLRNRRALRARLGDALNRLSPDIVNAHGEAPFIRAALDHHAPHVITLHGIFAHQTRAHGKQAPLAFRFAYSRMRAWERDYLPRIKALIAINSEIASYVRERAACVEVFSINNAVDPSLFSVEGIDLMPRILFIGQISRRKGIDYLLHAFANIADRWPSCSVRVVGDRKQDPKFAGDLERRFDGLIKHGRLVFTGPLTRPELAAELAGASMVCLPSLYEASPLVVIEAMAAGKPVVASRVGDVELLLGDGNAGLIVQPGDVASLALALETLLSDPRGRREMGQRGRQLARERASPTAIARLTLNAFQQTIDRQSNQSTRN